MHQLVLQDVEQEEEKYAEYALLQELSVCYEIEHHDYYLDDHEHTQDEDIVLRFLSGGLYGWTKAHV
jgi:hypothetical protein